MTLERLCAAVFADLNLNVVPSSATYARVHRYINEGVRAVMREPGLERLADSDQPVTFATVAGQARYAVSIPVARIQRISERTNDLTLEAMPMDRYRRVDPNAASHSGTPTHYVPIGRVAVWQQPLPPETLYAWSTDDNDRTRTIYVEGLTSVGLRDTAEAVLQGWTGVPLKSNFGTNTHAFETIEDLYLSNLGLGIVSLRAGVPTPALPGGPALTEGQELSVVGSTTLRSRCFAFYLWPTPSAAVTYYVDYRRELLDMINDSDEPPLPTDFHPMIAAYARMREYEKADDDRYAIARSEYERALGRLKFATQWASDELPVLGRAGRVGHSRLGSHYPADSWR